MRRGQQGDPRPHTPAGWCQVAAAWSSQASWKEGEEDGGEVVSSSRREFSCTGVRAQSRLLLDPLDLLAGEGAGEGARRMRAAAAVERAADAERSAQRVALQESREVLRRGRFLSR